MWLAKNDLNLNWPVYLRGCANSEIVFLGFKKGTNCHAWLTDGYREEGNNCYTDRYLHMNWGWAGSQNQFYFFNFWQPVDEPSVYNFFKPTYTIKIRL